MLEHRSDEIEIMDDLSISGEVINQTLRELNIINKLLGGNQISVSALKRLVKNEDKLKLADLGCGGGDIMVEMAKWSRKKGITCKVKVSHISKVLYNCKSLSTTVFELCV